jgi:hypothetical protein
VFRREEPFVQILVLPEEPSSNLRRCRKRRRPSASCIYRSRSTLSAETEWTSATDTVFDGAYRHILGAANERQKQKRHGE